MVGGLGAQAATDRAAAQVEGPDVGAVRCGDGHEHGAHLVAPVIPVRAGHAGGGQGQVTA